MHYPTEINRINTVYYQSLDSTELRQTRDELFSMLEGKKLIGENKDNATGLIYRISIKFALLSYFDGKCTEKEFNFAKKQLSVLQEALKKETLELVNTRALLNKAEVFLEELGSFFREAISCREEVIDASGQPISAEIKEFKNSAKKIEKIKEKALNKTKNYEKLFGEVSFYSLSEKITEILDREIRIIINQKEDIENNIYGPAIREVINTISRTKYRHYKYYSRLLDEEKAEAKIRVILSPFQEEVEFLFDSYIFRNNLLGSVMDLEKLSKNNKTTREYIFESLRDKCRFLLLINYLNASSIEEEIIKNIYELQILGITVFIHDKSGCKIVYKKLTEFFLEAENKPSISYSYFTLPFFNPIIEELKGLKIIDNEEDVQFVKKECKFMGFIGFNELVITYTAYDGEKWKSKARYISEQNKALALIYLSDLPSQDQLIDLDWGEVIKDSGLKREKRVGVPYDYDILREYDEKNIRRILDNPNFSLLEKAGLCVKYCLLNGENGNILATIEKEDLTIRLTRASKLLSKIINTEFDPDVQVIEKKNFPKEGAMGLCCDGGAVIKYRLEDMRDFTAAFTCVCHEMFHSFQHTIINTGWKDWHFTELGISRSRAKEWKINQGMYIDLVKDKDAYYVQCFEADARIFEADTLIAAGERWSMAQLE